MKTKFQSNFSNESHEPRCGRSASLNPTDESNSNLRFYLFTVKGRVIPLPAFPALFDHSNTLTCVAALCCGVLLSRTGSLFCFIFVRGRNFSYNIRNPRDCVATNWERCWANKMQLNCTFVSLCHGSAPHDSFSQSEKSLEIPWNYRAVES